MKKAWIGAVARMVVTGVALAAGSGPACGQTAPAPVPGGNATVDDYLNYALLHHPGLKAAFQRWKAAQERIPQARSLEDPQMTYEYFLQQKDLRQQLTVTQMFPGFGKRGWREREAVAEAEAAMHEFEAARLAVYDGVSRAYYEYRFLGRAIAVMRENQELLADLEKAVRTRYETGGALFSDLTKAQVEKDKVSNELASMLDERRVMSDKLAAAANLAVSGPLPWPRADPPSPAVVDDAVLSGMIETLNPELKAARAMIAKAEAAGALAKKSRIPDVMLGASLMAMPGMEGGRDEYDTGIMVGITLPLWRGRNTARVLEADAMAEAARQEQVSRRNSLAVDLRMAIFKFRDSERRMALFRDSLLPKAQQSLEAVRREYSVGKADFMGLVDAQRTVLEFSLMFERAAVDRELAMVEIGCCIGKYGGDLREAMGGK